MKKAVDGKIYDTEKAENILDWDNGRLDTRDFRFRFKTLFRTSKDNWFVLHNGGPMTDMAVPCGSNEWAGSSDIEPLSKDEVIKFLEEHNGAEVLEKYFPDAVEDA